MDMKRYWVLGISAYGVAVLLVFFPLLDSLLTVWPLQLGNVTWRFGAAGLFSRALMTPILGILLALATALAFQHRVVLRLASVLSALGAFGMVALAAVFVLDAAQARTQVVEAAASSFRISYLVAVMKYSLAALLSLLMALGGWLAASLPKKSRTPKEGSSQPSEKIAFKPPKA